MHNLETQPRDAATAMSVTAKFLLIAAVFVFLYSRYPIFESRQANIILLSVLFSVALKWPIDAWKVYFSR